MRFLKFIFPAPILIAISCSFTDSGKEQIEAPASGQQTYVTIIDSVHPAYREFLIGIDTLNPLAMSREETNAYLMKKGSELYKLKAKIVGEAPDKRQAYFEGANATSRFEEIKIRSILIILLSAGMIIFLFCPFILLQPANW